MSDIRAFAERFINAEFLALTASYLEPDEARYAALVQTAEAMLDSRPGQPMTLGFGRPPHPDAAWLERMRPAAAQFAARALFVIRRVEDPTHGTHWVAIVSPSQQDGLDEYAERWIIRERNGDLRIASQHSIDFRARDRVAWEHLSGAEIDPTGSVVDVQRVTAPGLALHRAEWETPAGGGVA